MKSLVAILTILLLGQSAPVAPRLRALPFNDQVWMAVSGNGTSFDSSAAKLVAERASAPDVIAQRNGWLLVYFVDFSLEGARSQGIGVAISTDSGATWRRRPVRIEGMTGIKAVDPDAVLLNDGRIRLYYFACSPGENPLDPASQPGAHEIRSAISSDGFLFKEETGARLALEGIASPDVIRIPDGRFRMYFPSHSGQYAGTTRSATSVDGLKFEVDSGVRLNFASATGAVVLPDFRIRLFYGSPQGIASSLSGNGLDFQPEQTAFTDTDRRGVSDPTIVRPPRGATIMMFKRSAPPAERVVIPSL